MAHPYNEYYATILCKEWGGLLHIGMKQTLSSSEKTKTQSSAYCSLSFGLKKDYEYLLCEHVLFVEGKKLVTLVPLWKGSAAWKKGFYFVLFEFQAKCMFFLYRKII